MISLTRGASTREGISYHYFLKRLHGVIRPQCYLEIGVDEGKTLALARCRAIGVDPSLKRLKQKRHIFTAERFGLWSYQPEIHLFEMTSDQFFHTQELNRLFDKKIDLAFLDGMHLFEFLLRDTINTERFTGRDSVIALHDCYPVNVEMSEREHQPDKRVDEQTRFLWTGDVWKLLPILRQYRPDLRLVVLDCPPTGLVLLTNLNPTTGVLRENYDNIIRQFEALTLRDFGLDHFRSTFPALRSRSLCRSHALRNLLKDKVNQSGDD